MNGIKYPNPLIEFRADPWIYHHTDGKYYFTATVPEYDHIELRVADTIAGLAKSEVHCIWHKHDSGGMSELIWAPEIHFIDGKWYIYFAAAPTTSLCEANGTFQHRMYVLEAENPLAVWHELGQVVSGMDTFCLDATTFEVKGIRYYVWAQKDPEIMGNSNLYIAKMKNPWTLATAPVMLTKPEYEWECSVIPVNEGPAALQHDNKIFLTYSANATGVEYCMGMLTADTDSDLLDPRSWKKSAVPVFASSEENRKYGPGHNCFTVAEDGETPLLVYHVREVSYVDGDPLQNAGRHTCVQAIGFHNGMPVFGEPDKSSEVSVYQR